MRIMLAGLVAALTLGMFTLTAVQLAGDNWPNEGSLPRVIHIAGDNWPNEG